MTVGGGRAHGSGDNGEPSTLKTLSGEELVRAEIGKSGSNMTGGAGYCGGGSVCENKDEILNEGKGGTDGGDSFLGQEVFQQNVQQPHCATVATILMHLVLGAAPARVWS